MNNNNYILVIGGSNVDLTARPIVLLTNVEILPY
jgi:hypothetical protein